MFVVTFLFSFKIVFWNLMFLKYVCFTVYVNNNGKVCFSIKSLDPETFPQFSNLLVKSPHEQNDK